MPGISVSHAAHRQQHWIFNLETSDSNTYQVKPTGVYQLIFGRRIGIEKSLSSFILDRLQPKSSQDINVDRICVTRLAVFAETIDNWKLKIQKRVSFKEGTGVFIEHMNEHLLC